MPCHILSVNTQSATDNERLSIRADDRQTPYLNQRFKYDCATHRDFVCVGSFWIGGPTKTYCLSIKMMHNPSQRKFTLCTPPGSHKHAPHEISTSCYYAGSWYNARRSGAIMAEGAVYFRHTPRCHSLTTFTLTLGDHAMRVRKVQVTPTRGRH
jgi:hypothetical protein